MTSREFVYLGWQGFDNFGDDLLHETWKEALDEPLDIEAPLFPKDYVKQLAAFLRGRLRLVRTESLVLLGGGTTIGFGNWAQHAKTAVRAYSAGGIVVAGAGAAASNDDYALNLQKSDWHQWRTVPGSILFGVRGPLTQVESQKNWRNPCSVVGDPALMYPRVAGLAPSNPLESRVLGVCLGSQTSTRFDVAKVATSIKEASSLSNLREIKVFQLANSDADIAQQLSVALGDVPIIVYKGDVRDMMTNIATCGVFVSERLHGAVAAVALGIPTVPLAYASKCDDFWLSVSGTSPKIGVGHSREELTAEIMSCQSEARLEVMASRRDALIEKLLVAASAMRSWKTGHLSLRHLQLEALTTNKMDYEDTPYDLHAVDHDELPVPSPFRAAADVSVVVPYGSGLGHLRAQINCLLSQDFSGELEIIVACNSSYVSPSVVVGEKKLPANVRLRSVDATAVTGPSFARNVGWKRATAEKIIFCDADDEVDGSWVSALSAGLDVAELVGGRLRYSKINNLKDAAWHHQTTDRLPTKFRHLEFVPSCNMGARRDVLEALGGFKTEISFGEDIDFCWRAQYAGLKLLFVPDAVVDYRLRTRLSDVWKQAFNYGASDAALLARHSMFGARRTFFDSVKEALATPWAAVAMLRRPWLVRKFVTRLASLSGRVAGTIRIRTTTL